MQMYIKGEIPMKKMLTLLMVLTLTLSAGLLTACGRGSSQGGEETAGVDLTILKEADDSMINTYTLLAVDPAAPFTDENGNAVTDVAVNTAGADALIQWLLSDEGIQLAADFGQEEYGDSLFYVLDGHPA